MHNRRYVQSLIIACAALSLSSAALGAQWELVEEGSSVSFTATQQGSRFTGRFGEFDAEISFDPADPASGRIVGTVQTDSVNTRDHDRDAALLDRDWFDTANHPQARFESERIEKNGDGGYRAHGQLTLKGKTKPAVMDFTFAVAESSSETAHFAGTMSVNRFDFDVGQGWNDTSWIGERVNVDVQLDLAL